MSDFQIWTDRKKAIPNVHMLKMIVMENDFAIKQMPFLHYFWFTWIEQLFLFYKAPIELLFSGQCYCKKWFLR